MLLPQQWPSSPTQFLLHFSRSLSIEVSNPGDKGAMNHILKMRYFSSVNERKRFMFAFIGKRQGNISKHENLLILLCHSSTNRRKNKRIFMF